MHMFALSNTRSPAVITHKAAETKFCQYPSKSVASLPEKNGRAGTFGLVGRGDLRKNYPMLECVVFYRHGSVWIGPPQFSRTYSQRQDADWEPIAQTESNSPKCDVFAGFPDSSPDVTSLMRKKSTFQGSFHHDDDYQFALAVQERF